MHHLVLMLLVTKANIWKLIGGVALLTATAAFFHGRPSRRGREIDAEKYALWLSVNKNDPQRRGMTR